MIGDVLQGRGAEGPVGTQPVGKGHGRVGLPAFAVNKARLIFGGGGGEGDVQLVAAPLFQRDGRGEDDIHKSAVQQHGHVAVAGGEGLAVGALQRHPEGPLSHPPAGDEHQPHAVEGLPFAGGQALHQPRGRVGGIQALLFHIFVVDDPVFALVFARLMEGVARPAKGKGRRQRAAQPA